MATIDTLCILVEVETIDAAFKATGEDSTEMRRKVEVIKRVIRSYEGQGRAEEDMELLQLASPGAHFRIDPIAHIER